MKHLFVAWQDSESGQWVPVARLDGLDEGYVLRYTRGANRLKSFSGLGRMSSLDKIYYSRELFPFFANRLLSKSRPEYKAYIRWLGLSDVAEDPMSLLSVSGGVRATDSIELIPSLIDDGPFVTMDFFPRGVNHLPGQVIDGLEQLKEGDELFLMRDVQNRHDPYAVALRSESPKFFLGYIARYYSKGVSRLLESDHGQVSVAVKRVNLDAPLSMKLLCTLKAPKDNALKSLESDEDFQPWVGRDMSNEADDEMRSLIKVLAS